MFKHVAVINLDRRIDRWKSFQNELPIDWPFAPPQRHSAFDAKNVPHPNWWKTGGGSWCCYRSHLRILEDALQHGIDSLLILEDDAIFHKQFTQRCQQFMSALPRDWNWIYLGGQHIKRFEHLPQQINHEVYRPHNINRTHAYGIRGRQMIKRLYHHLLDTLGWNPKHLIDHHYGELHRQIQSGLYVPREWLVGQNEGTSNISGQQLTRRFFRSAESLLHPKLDAKTVAVFSAAPTDGGCVAGILRRLGLDIGNVDNAKTNVSRLDHEAPGLRRLCTRLLEEKNNTANLSYQERCLHLRNWAHLREETMIGSSHQSIAGADRDLVLFWREILDSWNDPFVINVAPRDDTTIEIASPSDAEHFESRITAMRHCIDATKDSPNSITLTHLGSTSLVDQLISFLNLSVDPKRRNDAKQFQTSQNSAPATVDSNSN